jgi:PAS domain S-box-containing protein
MPDVRPSTRSSYGVAVAAVAIATALRAVIDPLTGDRAAYATYYAAVAAVAFFGNFGAAVFTIVLSVFLANYLFVPPRMSLAVTAGPDRIALLLFLANGLLITMLTERLNRVRQRLSITARAEADHAAAVLKERARLQAIIASIPGIVWEAWGPPEAPGRRTEFVSDYVTKMVGYTPDEWKKEPNFWLQLVPPDDRERVGTAVARTFASGDQGENEFRWITKDGRSIWVLARSTVIKDDEGRPVGMRGVTFDITDRKEAERQLALLSEISVTGLTSLVFDDLTARIARSAADAIGDYCIIRMLQGDSFVGVASAHVSPDAEPLVRAFAAEPVAAARSRLYAEMLRQPRTLVESDLDAAAFAHHPPPGMESLFGRHRPRRVLICPMISHGKLLGVVGLGRATGAAYSDSDVRLAEALASRAALALDNARLFEASQREAIEASRARQEAEEAGRVKDEFLATLSHELRTPLNAILGWAHMLRDPRLPDERRQAAIETIVRNAQSQEQLISDILDVQRIMAGKIRLNLRAVDLGNIVRAAAETVHPSAEAKNVRLQLLLDLDVTPISGDPDRLQQIVWNLLSNAIKFAPPSGRVQVRLSKSGNHCELVVEDNGPGIGPDFLPFVFERFRQADSSTTRTHKGLGLGLAIVRSLVEMHGGSIEAANVEGDGRTGAIFTIRLPQQATRPASEGDAAAPEPPLWLVDAPSLDGIRVLIVDDDHDARDLLTTILQRCGAKVAVASSAQEGFTLLSAERPDVLLSDIEMPEEDGYMFIKRVRALEGQAGGDVPAAALTAYASTGDRMKVLGAGFNMHVSKPVQPSELAMVVANLAGRHA